MKQVKIQTNTQVYVGEKPIDEVLQMAAELAHEVLDEMSIYRQRYDISDDFKCEASACSFLDAIGD